MGGGIAIGVAAVVFGAGCAWNPSHESGELPDLCRKVSDASFREAGYLPETKLVKGDTEGSPAPECTLSSENSGMLRIDLLTAPPLNGVAEYDYLLADARTQATAHGIDQPVISSIHGRDAFTRPKAIISADKSVPLGCSTTFRLHLGAIEFTVLPRSDDLNDTAKACAASLRVATTLEPAVD